MTLKKTTTMSIGELSKRSGIGIETIRYYERIGILAPLGRRMSGYRIFNEDSFKTLRFLKHAQELGFSLSEISDLLKLRHNEKTKCNEVQARASKHLSRVERKIEHLESIRTVLSDLIHQCKTRKSDTTCPILECFEMEEYETSED